VRQTYFFCFIVTCRSCRYIAAELLELSSKNSETHHRRVITAPDVCLAILQDAELQQCFGAFEVGVEGRVNAHNVISVNQEFHLKE